MSCLSEDRARKPYVHSASPCDGVAIAAGTEVSIHDADGSVLATVVTDLSTSSLVISTVGLVSGEDYTVTAGTLSSTATAGEAGGMTGGPGGGMR